MKKGWIIALCVLLVLGAGAGYGYYRLHGAAQEAEQTQQALYEQYQAMLQNAEQTTLTVTENGETAGTYTLLQLGLLEATEQAIAAGFTADERMDPAVFAQKEHGRQAPVALASAHAAGTGACRHGALYGRGSGKRSGKRSPAIRRRMPI